MPADTAQTLRVTLAADDDRPVLERLWALFRHDMSAFTGALPDEHGRFRQERLDAALAEDGWCAYVFALRRSPVGLAVVRGLGAEERVMNSFFLVRGARRSGRGLTAARHVVHQHRGRWAVAFQEANRPAAAFWRRVATDAVGRAWTEDRRAVPGRPELAPDSWIRFEIP